VFRAAPPSPPHPHIARAIPPWATPGFPACRLFARYARLPRIEISLNSRRDCSPSLKSHPALRLRVLRSRRRLCPSVRFRFLPAFFFYIFLSYSGNATGRESDAIPGITVSSRDESASFEYIRRQGLLISRETRARALADDATRRSRQTSDLLCRLVDTCHAHIDDFKHLICTAMRYNPI